MHSNNYSRTKVIAGILELKDCLHPLFFNADDNPFYYVRERLLVLSNFAIDIVKNFFDKFQVFDVLLSGSFASYTYCDDSDINIIIITKELITDNQTNDYKVQNFISDYITNMFKEISVFNYKVSINFSSVNQYKYFKSTYSLLDNEWISKPVKNNYLFSANELYESYLQLENNLYKQVQILTDSQHNYLTTENCNKLKKILEDIKNEAFNAKEYDVLGEYTMLYSTYRIAKRLGLFSKYNSLIVDSLQKTSESIKWKK